jgi:hypothetical protein
MAIGMEHEDLNRGVGLARLGLFIDDDNNLRVLDQEARQNTQQLIQECNTFIESKSNECNIS